MSRVPELAKLALRLGADIGGTFTDIVLLDPQTGATTTTKVLTTPDDPVRAILTGFVEVLRYASRSAQDVAVLVHGTTLATNAIIERRGARTALLTTEGFRDVLETGRELRYDLYSLALDLPRPLVPRRWRFAVRERMDAGGQPLTNLDEGLLSGVLTVLQTDRIESVAICLLHSYVNPDHERTLAAAVRRRFPEMWVSLSSAVLPRIGEYLRVSTTAANAYVQPLIAGYLSRMSERLLELGFQGEIALVASNGGMIGVQDATEVPAALIESGPAAGITAAGQVAAVLGCKTALAFDMGGTTAKMCLVRDGLPSWTSELEVARTARFQRGSGLPIALPSVDLIEVGAGGGSIARLDALGLLEVGPDSAGALPGPACYGLGGVLPTVTDANLLLGYLNPSFFAGGSVRLCRTAAAAAMLPIAQATGRTAEGAASDIFETVTGIMANSALVHAAEKGVDVRSCTIIAFGGAGPVHAWRIAELLAVPSVVIPSAPGVLSALGCVTAPARCDISQALVAGLCVLEYSRFEPVAAALRLEADKRLDQTRAPRVGRRYAWSVDMKCSGQRYVINVPLMGLPRPDEMTQTLRAAFEARYRGHYGRLPPGVPVEIESIRLTATGPELAIGKSVPSPKHVGKVVSRSVRFGADEWDTPVHKRSSLASGTRLAGPTIIEDTGSTIVVPPYAHTHIDSDSNVHISLLRGAERREA